MDNMNRVLRRALALLLLMCLMITAAACGEKADQDYYRAGLKITGVMDEMLASPEYMSMIYPREEAPETVSALYGTREEGDTPARVYRLIQQDPRAVFTAMVPASEREMIYSLSPALQEQFWNRLRGPSFLCNWFNAQKGTELLALSSALTVLLDIPELEPEQAEYFLFVYEKGVPVLVSCGRHTATGTALFLDKAETESDETLKTLFQPYGFEVIPFDIPAESSAGR